MMLKSYKYIHTCIIQSSSPARKSKLSESLLTRELLKVILSPRMHHEQPIVRRLEAIEEPHLGRDRFLRGFRFDCDAFLREVCGCSEEDSLRC